MYRAAAELLTELAEDPNNKKTLAERMDYLRDVKEAALNCVTSVSVSSPARGPSTRVDATHLPRGPPRKRRNPGVSLP